MLGFVLGLGLGLVLGLGRGLGLGLGRGLGLGLGRGLGLGLRASRLLAAEREQQQQQGAEAYRARCDRAAAGGRLRVQPVRVRI